MIEVASQNFYCVGSWFKQVPEGRFLVRAIEVLVMQDFYCLYRLIHQGVQEQNHG